MRVLVAYESRGGRTRRAAEEVAREARELGHEAILSPIAEVDAHGVGDAQAVFIGAWVEGFIVFGVGPAAAVRRWIAELPGLDGKPAGVFCTYAFHPRRTLEIMARDLEAKGARVVGRQAAHRRRPEEGAREFVRTVLGAAGT